MKTNTKTPPGPSVLKWSSKPSDHNAVRVRNNQRRHRARAKEHVQDLERRLEETSARLEAALQTISHLAQEVEILRGRVIATPSPTEGTGPGPDKAHIEAQPMDSMPIQDSPKPDTEDPTPLDVADMTVSPPPPPPPPPAEPGDNADCGCDGGLPPQAPGESTLSCSSAFRIIEQQSLSGVEVTTIRAWLGPGFRRALRPGEACRVETNRVYELLDHITSLS
ncbi:hypothetical protein DHEL01_v204802 [Diaporthe helianthi]|uniref:BZIP domain-containing protein n=1 Tax=Diaporthe helianthi TaxID=158607 RepID=A0A2P5I2V4_DIAHE|nr:hypothetical protein DHEL01_v204802 [Diaporthe helianthi]